MPNTYEVNFYNIFIYLFLALDPPIDVSIYSLIGATAMMSGFARITISLCVIVTELTGSKFYLLFDRKFRVDLKKSSCEIVDFFFLDTQFLLPIMVILLMFETLFSSF